MTDPAETDRYILYGAELSLYTGKVRAYLRYKGIDFEERLADLKTVKQVLYPKVRRKMVPIVVTPDEEYLQDSTHIIDRLEEVFTDAPVRPSTPRQRLVSLLFEHFGDEWLLLPAMHYRWRYDWKFIVREMSDMLVPGKPLYRQLPKTLPVIAYFGIGARRAIGVSKITAPAIESWYEEFLAQFDRHLEHYPFLLGSRPSIGDYGLMGPLYAHLYRDPNSGTLMKELAPRVADWVERMNDPQPNSGDFLEGDEVPQTLFPILERLFDEQFPVLLDTVRRVAEWIDKNPGERMPRMIGRHTFTIGEAQGRRIVLPYNQWMLQRTVDFYRSLSGADKISVDTLLDEVGGRQGMQVQFARRVERVKNRVIPA